MKRRGFVKAAAASLPTFGILSAARARAQSKEIHMIESGGLSGDSIQVGYIDPLKSKTGINVVRLAGTRAREQTAVAALR